ncbi:MAG: MvdC/MvdD family ATP grasp protein [Planctomycetota bacterium]
MTRAQDTVLILTHSADEFVVERVASAVSKRGARALRFDTDLFPSEVRLSSRFDGAQETATLHSHEFELSLDLVRAVWARKVWLPKLSEGLDARVREGCVRESAAALRSFLSALDERRVRWVNGVQQTMAGEDKLRQLRVASKLGLRTPRTLVSNDPEAVRAFRADIGPMIAKMLTPLSISMGGSAFFMHTNLVRDEDLEQLDGLRMSPMVFQEHVEKRCELRIACVGDRAFVGRIDASRSEKGQVDWRRSRPDEVDWTRGEIPSDVAEKLAALLRELDLVYGAVDVIVTPEGEHVFLEINPSGEWGMLERDLDLPIADAIASELMRAPSQRAQAS